MNETKKVYLVMQGAFDDKQVMGTYSTKSKVEKAILKFRDELVQEYKNQMEVHKSHLENEEYKQEMLKAFQMAIKNIHSHKPYTMKDIEEMIKADISSTQNRINDFDGSDWTKWESDWDVHLWIQEHDLDN